MEEWKPIVGYENYEVSNLGQVRNVKSGRILKPQMDKDGYLRLELQNPKKIFRVHRLVLQTFLPTEEDLQCDHINHIKTDNYLCNLRWVTCSQNLRYRRKPEDCSSQYKGVTWDKYKWKVACYINKKKYHIGMFDDEHEAGKAYNDFVIKHNLQDFVVLNEIS